MNHLILEDCRRWAKLERPTFNFGAGAIGGGARSEGARTASLAMPSDGGEDFMPCQAFEITSSFQEENLMPDRNIYNGLYI